MIETNTDDHRDGNGNDGCPVRSSGRDSRNEVSASRAVTATSDQVASESSGQSSGLWSGILSWVSFGGVGDVATKREQQSSDVGDGEGSGIEVERAARYPVNRSDILSSVQQANMEATESSECPVKHDVNAQSRKGSTEPAFNFRNNEFAYGQSRAPGQTIPLSTTRQTSSIPKGDYNPAHQPENITEKAKVELTENEERMIRVLKTALEASVRTDSTPPPVAQQQAVQPLKSTRFLQDPANRHAQGSSLFYDPSDLHDSFGRASPDPTREMVVYTSRLDNFLGPEALAGDVCTDQCCWLCHRRYSSRLCRSRVKNGGDKWVYPSEQQYFNAIKRKGHRTDAADMPTTLAIHNAVNEKGWAMVAEWERLHAGRNDAPPPKLLRFEGRPQNISPKAWIKTYFLGYQAPFDRHDWVVQRHDGSTARYVIDFYSGHIKPGSKVPVALHLDVRPALDSVDAVVDRTRMFFLKEMRPRFSGVFGAFKIGAKPGSVAASSDATSREDAPPPTPSATSGR